jgi:acetolactate decarboxylase
MRNTWILAVTGILLLSCEAQKKEAINNSVHVIGAMKNVMMKGQLSGSIDLDTISDKTHLYGLGPVEYLAGELLIVDGKSYKSTIINDTAMKVETTFKAKAPFFVYAQVEEWIERILPDSVQSIQQLEFYLNQQTKAAQRPFAFKLTGIVDTAKIHVVNLPTGAEVNSPKDAHVGQRDFSLINLQAEIIGFFSTEHQSIFTHHDSFLHMHLLTEDKSKMGHLDEVNFGAAMKLYLPKE